VNLTDRVKNAYEAADRLQHTRMFKVVATVIILVIALGFIVTQYVRSAARAGEQRMQLIDPANVPLNGQTAADTPQAAPTEAEQAARKQVADLANTQIRLYNRLVSNQNNPAGAAVATLALAVPLIGAIWLGLGITYLFLGFLGAVIAFPLIRFGSPFWHQAGVFAAGVLVLAASFSALVQASRLLLSASTPITAIARNVVAEAVRMKISLVFIVLLIIALAALPGLLDPTTPLRYRVQSFLQYGSSAAYWLSAVLVLFLSCATVAFEQRDKIIWQTMTKPVRPWQFIAGKWLGVMTVACILLAVACTGVFLFTEYLRRTQPAQGEVTPYRAEAGQGVVVEDRLVLESQILVGRRIVRPHIPESLAVEVEEGIKNRYAELRRMFEENPRANLEPKMEEVRKEVESQALANFLSLGPGDMKPFEFIGMQEAKDFDLPLTLRYTVNSGANNPTDFFRVTFLLPGSQPFVRSVPLGQPLTLPLSTAAIEEFPDRQGDERHVVRLGIVNGDVQSRTPNEKSINFIPDGLEISYASSSFHGNYFRVVLVMIFKIAMLAMIGVVCATFLSFPVACMVAFGTFLLAETADYLNEALEYFGPTHDSDTITIHYKVISAIAQPLATLFKSYAELSPVSNLVQGKLIDWSTVGWAFAVLGIIVLALGAIGSIIFKNRELATYSGQ
jgi:ABC-type transport system involved in multi-copper enzyme maturation permease subunit